MISELESIEIGGIEQIRALRSLFGLQSVSTPALAALAAHANPVRIPKGTQLGSEGRLVTEAFVVIEGELATHRSGRALGTFGARSVVGALALFARDARGFECIATRDSIALALRADEVLEVFEDHFEMMHAVLRALSHESIDTRLGLPNAGFSTAIRTGIERPIRPLDLVERLIWLRQVFALNSPRLDAVAELARTCEEVRYARGTRLWSIGDRSDRMLTVVSGVIGAETAGGARFRFGPLDIVGSMDLVAAVPRWYDTVVEEDVVALALDAELVIDLWEDNPDLSFAFLQILASTLLALRERLYADQTPHAETASR